LPAIGFLDGRSPEAVVSRLRALRQGLREIGYVEGENVAIVYRFADNQLERLADLAKDLMLGIIIPSPLLAVADEVIE